MLVIEDIKEYRSEDNLDILGRNVNCAFLAYGYIDSKDYEDRKMPYIIRYNGKSTKYEIFPLVNCIDTPKDAEAIKKRINELIIYPPQSNLSLTQQAWK